MGFDDGRIAGRLLILLRSGFISLFLAYIRRL
jgi:hypothetical protein